MIKKLLVIPALALLLSVGAPAHAQNTCGEVCTRDFWLNSTQAEIEAAFREVGVNARNEDGETPLHWASSRGTPEDIVTLLEAGADVHARTESGSTPLHRAAESETPENIRILLEAGADVNARNAGGWTPLLSAAAFGNPENILTLFEAGANLSARTVLGYTALHSAVSLGTPENVLALLEAGADPTVEDEFGRIPFDLAQENEDLIGTDAYWALNDARLGESPGAGGTFDK